jgi:hypothetical protein
MTSRRAQRRNPKIPARVVIAGEGIVATPLEQKFEMVQERELAPKRPGEHRWIATAGFFLSDEAVSGAYDKDQMKFLDQENIFTLSIGCWDCEKPLGDPAKGGITYGSRCHALGEGP